MLLFICCLVTDGQAQEGQTGQKCCELLHLSKRFIPGEFGVIEEGVLADTLLVNGNPLENLDLVADPAETLALIMKDGRIYKNAIR